MFFYKMVVLDSTGAEVVQYVYDAWGNHTVTDTSGISLGTKNPFRYRSYFYDTETKLYYLKTRYYDPYTGRFINMDGIQYADPETINGLNLYTYCNNNPVNYVDPDGNIFFSIILSSAFFGAVAGAITGAVKAVANGESWWKGALIGGLEGGVLGAALGVGGAIGTAAFAAGTTVSLATGLTALAAVSATSFAAGMGIYALENKLTGGEFSVSNMIKRGFALSLNASLNFGAGLLFGSKGLFEIPKNTKNLNLIQKSKLFFMNMWNGKNLLMERTYLKIGAVTPFQMIINKLFL